MIVGGLIYLIWPTLRPNPHTKNNFYRRVLTDDEYIKYMRRIGAMFVVLGVLWVLYDLNRAGKLSL